MNLKLHIVNNKYRQERAKSSTKSKRYFIVTYRHKS